MKVAVILNGCGHADGSEIHEAVLAMLALQQKDMQFQCLGFNKSQAQVIDHITGNTSDDLRNLMTESARIARGNIKDISTAQPEDFAAVIIPGGTGTASNICTFASEGEHMTVEPQLVNFLRGMHEQHKPIGAICIAPVILAAVFGKQHPKLTIGNSTDINEKLNKMGATAIPCDRDCCVIDENNRLVTTPAYMYADSTIPQVYAGIYRLVEEVIRLTR